VLINNVGLSHDEGPVELTDVRTEDIESIIRVNCTFTTLLTRALIPKLRATLAGGGGGGGGGSGGSVARRACIVNLSSASALIPSPLLAIYAATKAFDDSFSYALSAELAPYRVDVMSELPSFVQTNMSKLRKSSLFTPAPETYADAVVHNFGRAARAQSYWVHHAYVTALTYLPDAVGLPLMRHVYVNMRKMLAARSAREAARAAASGGGGNAASAGSSNVARSSKPEQLTQRLPRRARPCNQAKLSDDFSLF
jgi:17beta-estradiol 17-dehydrogenase / very-long-chain 3-oxoacyl-CoA reductase